MRFTKFLASKLFVIVLLVMLISTGVFTTMMLDWHSDKYLSITKEWAQRTSDLIRRSTRYSMMENRREDIYQTITTLSSEPGSRRFASTIRREKSHFPPSMARPAIT